MMDGFLAEMRRIQDRVKEVEAELLKLSDCDEFLAIVGRGLHDAFKERFPITQNTKVQRVRLGPGQRTWRYVIPQPINLWTGSVLSIEEAISPILQTSEGTALFECWGTDDPHGFRVLLAYAADIDVIFWDGLFR